MASEDGFESAVGSLVPDLVNALLRENEALRKAVYETGAEAVAYSGHGRPIRASERQRILENFRNAPLTLQRLAEGLSLERLFGGTDRLRKFRECRERPAPFVPCHPGTHFEVPVTARGTGAAEDVEIHFVLRGILEQPSVEDRWSVRRPTADQVTTSC